MSESNQDSASSTQLPTPTTKQTRTGSWLLNGFLLFVLIPVSAAILLYQLDSFDPAALPLDELTQKPVSATNRNDRMLHGSEKIGLSQLLGPEDLVYDPYSEAIYTGCADGWVKRVTVNESAADSVIQDVVYTGGRPLGLALGQRRNIIVGDADKGLLNATLDGKVVEILTDEADGLKFKLTDGVDVANDGVIYFTDASYKYNLNDYLLDVYECRPHGRLLSYDPINNLTKVLLSNLYFANGVVVSPDQTHLVFCETLMKRCRKYYIEGEKKGSVEEFVHLPGVPDNIHYDGVGNYWIAIPSGKSKAWDALMRYPILRKIVVMFERYVGRLDATRNGGVMVVDVKGNPVSHYYDVRYAMGTAGIKVGDYLYCGSVVNPYILRLNIDQHPAHPVI